MDMDKEAGYQPPPEFEEDARDPLVDLNLTDSTELWLIQWPVRQVKNKIDWETAIDFDGKEFSLNLNQDGVLGSFEGSSGKSYDVVSFASQDPDASVFVPSASGSKVIGKISRRVSLLHYPDPKELQKEKTEHLRQMYEKSSGTSLNNSSRRTPSQSNRTRRSNSASGRPSSTHSSRPKSFLSDLGGEESKSQRGDGPTRSAERSTLESGRSSHGGATSSGSVGDSAERKSKKKKKIEG